MHIELATMIWTQNLSGVYVFMSTRVKPTPLQFHKESSQVVFSCSNLGNSSNGQNTIGNLL